MRSKRLVVLAFCSLVMAGLGTELTRAGGTPAISQVHIPFGELPSVAVRQGEFMWVLDRWGETLGKIDPRTNEVVREWDLTETFESNRIGPWDLDATKRALWVTEPTKRTLYELDPETGEVLSKVRTRGHVSDVHIARGSLWFMDEGDPGADLVRVSARSGGVVKRFRFGSGNTDVTGVVEFERSMWVVRGHARHVAGGGPNPTYFVSAQLWQVDPASNEVLDRTSLGSTYTRGAVNPVVGDVEATHDGLWMSRVHEKRLVLLNPVNARVLNEVSLGDFEYAWEFALAEGDLWVGDLNRRRTAWIDTETKQKAFVDVGAGTSFIGGAFGSAWAPVTADRDGDVVRLTSQ